MSTIEDLVDKYLEGEMDDEAQATFEARLAEDAALQKELKSQKAARAAIQIFQLESQKERLRTYAKAYSKKKGDPTFSYRKLTPYFISLAAAVVLVLILGRWLFVSDPIEKTLRLHKQNMEYLSANKSEGEQIPIAEADSIRSLLQAIHSGDGEELRSRLKRQEQYVKEDPNPSMKPRLQQLALFLGWGYYELGAYTTAYHYFQEAEKWGFPKTKEVAKHILTDPRWQEKWLQE